MMLSVKAPYTTALALALALAAAQQPSDNIYNPFLMQIPD
jgi:hypothetical protein